MLLTGYSLEIFKSKCQADSRGVHCFAHLNDDVSEVLPYLNTLFGGFVYTVEPPSLMVKNYGKLITIHARKSRSMLCRMQRRLKGSSPGCNGKLTRRGSEEGKLSRPSGAPNNLSFSKS